MIFLYTIILCWAILIALDFSLKVRFSRIQVYFWELFYVWRVELSSRFRKLSSRFRKLSEIQMFSF